MNYEQLINDRDSIEAKLGALHAEILSEQFASLPDAEQGRMVLQFKVMEAYALVLEQRIVAGDDRIPKNA